MSSSDCLRWDLNERSLLTDKVKSKRFWSWLGRLADVSKSWSSSFELHSRGDRTGSGLDRVEISCAGENTRSRAIPPRLGFTHEATRREYIWLGDHYADQLIFGLLAREWKAGL